VERDCSPHREQSLSRAIYNDLDLLLRTVRDMFTPEVGKLIIDSRAEYDKIKKFIAAFMPDFTGQIELYDGPEPSSTATASKSRSTGRGAQGWLKSGGYSSWTRWRH